jgi:phosphoribosylaminoimidazole-succinocarboxamide synthase
MPVMVRADLPGLKKHSEGKVRAMFALGRELLIVTTDRISAFDVVLPDGIPSKGEVLNRLSEFWFGTLQVPHHMITTDVSEMPEAVRRHAEALRGRSMLVRRAEVVPIECVARGYLIGSGWKDYQATGAVCGIPLPRGLRLADRLPEPIFTPATKETTGHDINIGFDEMARRVGDELASRLRDLTLQVYSRAAAYALERGLILADTKLEFGLVDGQVTLVDEVLTPDSSRFWPRDAWRPGANPPSFDKQFVRDYLESIRWNKTPPAPPLPPDVIENTSRKYLEAYRLLTGKEL